MNNKRVFSLLVCFLVIVDEFGPASFARLQGESLKAGKVNRESKHKKINEEENGDGHETAKKGGKTELVPKKH